MVFFNYSTMQMAAKVVYYGPGLCGKTTNLHYIYGHTTHDSRGEMVSLETETDRTLFFDLLPLDVGSIAGFNTRIQLYTVPGQVFYNTTRKLVLKGVDGVVFVVDSQRAMLQANLDSFRNLEENLSEMGLAVDSLPLVLQYNKRDLADIYSVEELNQAINRHSWPWYETSAVSGQGVFETLKGISKYTLLALKKRLGRSGADAPTPLSAPGPAPGQPARPGTLPATPPAMGAAGAGTSPRPLPIPVSLQAPPPPPQSSPMRSPATALAPRAVAPRAGGALGRPSRRPRCGFTPRAVGAGRAAGAGRRRAAAPRRARVGGPGLPALRTGPVLPARAAPPGIPRGPALSGDGSGRRVGVRPGRRGHWRDALHRQEVERQEPLVRRAERARETAARGHAAGRPSGHLDPPGGAGGRAASRRVGKVRPGNFPGQDRRQ